MEKMTGYDLVFFLRSWLEEQGWSKLSVCEVILMDERFSSIRRHIGRSDLFWSHVQAEPFLGEKFTEVKDDEKKFKDEEIPLSTIGME